MFDSYLLALKYGPEHFLSSIFKNSRHVSACFTLFGAAFHRTAPEYLRERVYRSRQLTVMLLYKRNIIVKCNHRKITMTDQVPVTQMVPIFVGVSIISLFITA